MTGELEKISREGTLESDILEYQTLKSDILENYDKDSYFQCFFGGRKG